jgi:hypothetical protein
MGHARVLRPLGEGLLQDRRRLALLSVTLVGRRRGEVERQRVEDRRLAILGIGQVELLHDPLVGEGAGRPRDGLVVLEERLHRADVIPLARGLRAGGAALLDGGPGRLGPLRGRRCAEHVLGPAERQPPGGDRAAGVALGDGREGVARARPPERVEQRDRMVQVGLHLGHARAREAHLAGGAVVVALMGAHRPGQSGQCGDKDQHEGDDARGAQLRAWGTCRKVRLHRHASSDRAGSFRSSVRRLQPCGVAAIRESTHRSRRRALAEFAHAPVSRRSRGRSAPRRRPRPPCCARRSWRRYSRRADPPCARSAPASPRSHGWCAPPRAGAAPPPRGR